MAGGVHSTRYTTPMRIPPRILDAPGVIILALCLVAMGVARAGGLADPFSTTDGIAPYLPCAAAAEESPLTLSRVVDLALCANPQTREAWANARAQAAQLGVAEAAWLPGVDATASAGRSRTNGVSADTRKESINASWLLFDFGGREAGIWIDGNVPSGAKVMTIGPTMANIVMYYSGRRADALSVSPNPLRRNPSYSPIINPDHAVRAGTYRYLVWDAYSAARSPSFSSRLLGMVRKYGGRVVHSESAVFDGTMREVVVIYEVKR